MGKPKGPFEYFRLFSGFQNNQCVAVVSRFYWVRTMVYGKNLMVGGNNFGG